MSEVHIEAKEVHVLHGFQLHWIAEEIRMYQGLGADVVQEGVVERDEAVVDIAIVGKVNLGVIGQAML